MRLALATIMALTIAAPAQAAPVLGAEVPAGTGTLVQQPNRKAPERRLDGRTRDWPGALAPYAGAIKHARGTLTYRDHITDAYGPDNGQDTIRLGILDPAAKEIPELFRLDPAYQYVPGEFGVPTGPLDPRVHYGDLPHVDEADLSEVRLGTDAGRNLWLLARTTAMADDAPATALLVLLDTTPGDTARPVGYNSGLTTTTGDVAVYLGPEGASATDLATGDVRQLPAPVYRARGYDNAIEARLPALGVNRLGVALAAGLSGGKGELRTLDLQPNVANVAFRTTEPARDWWDKQQGLDLYRGTMDRFFTPVDLNRLARGADERYVAGPGYHDRIFRSDPRISSEKGEDGILQHYGLYLPKSYRAGQLSPAQWWFHFRGGNAHIAAAVVPGLFRDFGEAMDSVVITPDGRGERGWYVGDSQLDYLEVYRDVHKLLTLDRDREYIAGHSMGGWASYLLPTLYPDRFAATAPASAPPTQGGWLGCEADDCYIQANGGDAKAELTTPLLGNLRNVPAAIFQGTEDELVPLPGVLAQAARFAELGLRYRLYLFEGQEHYGPPIQDEWTEQAAFEHAYVRDRNPGRVTYSRSMPFERAVNTVNNEDKVRFGFRFDRAYWMSGLRAVDRKDGVASFDGRALARPEPPHTLVPEVGGPAAAGQSGPYSMTGQAWKVDADARPKPRNGFAIELTGARAVTLNLRRMGIDLRRRAFGKVKTEARLRLRLVGRHGRTTKLVLPTGKHRLKLGRRGRGSAARA